MGNKKYILLRDPWGVVEDRDTGFGNRLICWYVVNLLNQNQDFEIKTLQNEFPESSYLNIPNTTTLSNPTKEEYKYIQEHHILEYLKNGKITLDKNFNWHTQYDWDITDKVYRTTPLISDYFESITIKSPEFYSSILNFTQNLIGVHVRRGNGVRSTYKDLLDLPENIKDLFPLNPKGNPNYKFTPEKTLIKIIENFLNLNNPPKIYLSLDLPEETVSHLKNRYGTDKILTRSDFILQNQKIIKHLNLLKPILNLKSIGYNLIDFFILAYSKFMILSPGSTWGGIGQQISSRPGRLNDEPIEDIIKDYNELSSK